MSIKFLMGRVRSFCKKLHLYSSELLFWPNLKGLFSKFVTQILYFGDQNSTQVLKFLSKFSNFCQVSDPQLKKPSYIVTLLYTLLLSA